MPLLMTRQDGLTDLRNRPELRGKEERPPFFPEEPLASHFVPRGAEQETAPLKNLVNQKCRRHQQRRIDRQMLQAVAVLMREVVSLLLQRVERLVLNLPAAAASRQKLPRITAVHFHGGDPGEDPRLICRRCPLSVSHERHPQVRMGVMLGNVRHNRDQMLPVRFPVLVADRHADHGAHAFSQCHVFNASARLIAGRPIPWSGIFAKLVRTIENRASADKCFRSGPTMAAPGSDPEKDDVLTPKVYETNTRLSSILPAIFALRELLGGWVWNL